MHYLLVRVVFVLRDSDTHGRLSVSLRETTFVISVCLAMYEDLFCKSGLLKKDGSCS